MTDAVDHGAAYFDDSQRPGHQGRRQDRRPRRPAHRRRADGRALAYGLDKDHADQTILVFDLSSGTFDVSILELGDGVFEVIDLEQQPPRRRQLGQGRRRLDGGRVQARAGHRPSKDPMALQRVYDKAEEAKIQLSSAQSAPMNLPVHRARQRRPAPPRADAHARQAEQRSRTSLVERAVGPVEQALRGRRPRAQGHRAGALMTRRRPACPPSPTRSRPPGGAVAASPGPGRRRRRHHAGRRAQGEVKDVPAARG